MQIAASVGCLEVDGTGWAHHHSVTFFVYMEMILVFLMVLPILVALVIYYTQRDQGRDIRNMLSQEGWGGEDLN
jgi:hypothetical protein